ncbi:Signal recognition particle [Tilletia horrida]|nr:Signal recognition particle [Tilletia horrida]
MVLSDLGKRLTAALGDLSRARAVDDATLDALLKSISTALLQSDVNVKLVARLRDDVRAAIRAQLQDDKAAQNWTDAQKKNAVQRTIYEHLVRLVDPHSHLPADQERPQPFSPTKLSSGGRDAKTSVIMFVGLQGAGKTTSCTKLALYYHKRGFKTGLVCADTFRAGAFDQLKQNAAKANVPFYGSYTEADPVSIARAGVNQFKANRFDLVIVDTSGRHKQEADLFEEMVEIQQAVKPDQTIMVLDASMGQAAESQSRAFKETADFGAIFVTKLDGHAKGGGAISAVAATRTPIIFIGTGEHATDLEPFRPGPFISKLLGMGDMAGFMDKMQEVAMSQNPERQKAMMEKIVEGGTFTIRDWKEQVGNIMGMGPLSKLAGMIPGMGSMLGAMNGPNGEDEAGSKMKRMIYIMDSMTAAELDSDGSMFYRPVAKRKRKNAEIEESGAKGKGTTAAKTTSMGGKDKGKAVTKDSDEKSKKKPHTKVRLTARARQIAQGSGTSVREVEDFLVQYRMISGMVKKMGGKSGWLARMNAMKGGAGAGKGGMPPAGMLPPGMSREQVMQMQNSLPPEIKAQLRQPGGREKLLQQIQSGDIPPGLANMPGMGGMGGLGGLGSLMGGAGGAGGLGGLMGGLQNLMGGMGGGGAGAAGGMPDMATLQRMMGAMGGGGGGGGGPGAGGAGGMPDMAALQRMMGGLGGGGGGGR